MLLSIIFGYSDYDTAVLIFKMFRGISSLPLVCVSQVEMMDKSYMSYILKIRML